ncbi:cyclic nucleotide-binding domain-containing protein [Devosia sp.]|uniref:cyclic nucleotide-binding domain-containing protein n=1 Tax=Devosia sp. TaxID=1871048 RepID=UPI003A955DBE
MASLITLIYSAPTRTLEKGEVLISQGDEGGDIFVLETGTLSVERDGVEIATITEMDSLIGEMSVLLGREYTATVRAVEPTKVRVVEDAIRILERQPLLTLHLATLLCERLDATSALLVEMNSDKSGGADQKGWAGRLLSSILTPPKPEALPNHE